MDERNDDDILDGRVPGFGTITLGGRDYEVREPTNRRARVIRRALADLDRAQEELGETDPELFTVLDDCYDTCIKSFSEAIENDWAHIEEHATDRERQEAMEAIQEAITAPFVVAANRATRRAKKSPAKKRAGRRSTT